QLPPRPAVAGKDEDDELARELPRVVGEDTQALRTRDHLADLRDGEHLDAVVGPLLRPRGKHLPRPRPVELLGAVEERDPDARHAGRRAPSARSSAGPIASRSLKAWYRPIPSASTSPRRTARI